MSGYYTAVAALSGLVAFWKLDESGASATDSSGNGNTGTYTGSPSQQQTSIIPGEPTSGCVLFNGSSQYVTVNDAAGFSLPTTGALSFGMWVKPTATGASTRCIFGKGDSSGTKWEWEIARYSSPNFGGILYQSNGTPRNADIDAPAGPSKADDATYFLVVTLDDSGSDAGICYLNGTAGTTATPFAGSSTDGTSLINIGRRPDASRYFPGSVQGLFVTSTVLSQGTVTDLYTAGITPPSSRIGIGSDTLATLGTLAR